jgi:hypothetical protein
VSDFIQIFSLDDDDGGDEEVESEAPRQTPPWFGPPADELGVVVPLDLVVGRSEKGVVALTLATIYSTGLAFAAVAAARGLSNSEANRLFHEQHMFEDGEEPPSGFLRFGLELPDGERVSNLRGRTARRHFMKPDVEPEGPVLMENGGGGGSGVRGTVTMRPGFWLWPPPGAGTLRVFCEWPLVEIPLSSVEIDTGDLVAAAARVVPLWPMPSA